MKTLAKDSYQHARAGDVPPGDVFVLSDDVTVLVIKREQLAGAKALADALPVLGVDIETGDIVQVGNDQLCEHCPHSFVVADPLALVATLYKRVTGGLV